MKVLAEPFPSTWLIETRVFQDSRGMFIKTYHEEEFIQLGVSPVKIAEQFFSVSAQGVLRGMHFQVPPVQHSKLVFCAAGKVLDVVLDLRREEASFGQFWSIELHGGDGKILVLPPGMAHGFLTLEDNTILVYNTTCAYSPTHDCGVHWDSFGFRWPVPKMVSERDRAFPRLEQFASPF